MVSTSEWSASDCGSAFERRRQATLRRRSGSSSACRRTRRGVAERAARKKKSGCCPRSTGEAELGRSLLAPFLSFLLSSGRRAVFAGGRGSAAVEQLTKRGVAQFPYGMTPDGTGLVILEANAAARGGGDLALLPVGVNAVAAGPARRALVQTSFTEANAALSPDGRWLAYQSHESGRDEVYVRPFPNVDGGRVQVSAKGGRTPLWARTQDRLFYRTADGAVMAVRVKPGPAWANSPPVQALAAGYFDSTAANSRAFDVSPDGQRFLMIKNAETNDTPASTIVIVQNWLEELKRLVPTN
jgi:hypothetical protein